MADETIRVMSFNLRYASAPDGDNSWNNANQAPQRRDVAVRVITNRNPDVIGFQEGEAAQLDYLASQLPAYTFDRRGPSGGGGNENACLEFIGVTPHQPVHAQQLDSIKSSSNKLMKRFLPSFSRSYWARGSP
jgi:hypothetical protein